MITTEPKSPRGAAGATLIGRDLLSLAELTRADIEAIFASGAAFKADPAAFRTALSGRSFALLFEKPSLRTRVSFEVGIAKLGGHAMYFDQSGSRLGERESIHDLGKNLERFVDGIVARVFNHGSLEELAAATRVPVINALSDRFHPCQGLADFFTLKERLGTLEGKRVSYIGDGNNVCHSLLHGAGLLGVNLVVITPEGYAPAKDVVEQARNFGAKSGAELAISHDPSAVAGADAVYTDVWVSMGQAEEARKRLKAFAKYQVTKTLMAKAGEQALFLHCLPAHRGVEVSDDVMDSAQSVVFDQAENRMHVQNGLLLLLRENP